MRLALAALSALAAALHPAAAQSPPDWLVGRWIACAEGRETTEAWTGGGGLLAGASVTRRAGRASLFEHMRIAPHGDGLAFFGSPGGAPPTPFPMVSHDGRRATFENLGHDHPQRIVYAREGRTLTARIEAADGSRASTWRYRLARPGERCPGF